MREFRKVFNKTGWKSSAISIYNHWLSEEETGGKILSYYDIDPEERNFENYIIFEQRILSFYRRLFATNNTAILKKLFSLSYYHVIQDCKEYNKVCIENIRETKFNKIFYLNDNIILEGSYDLTTLFFYKNKESFSKVKRITIEEGLFLLDR